MKMCPVCNAFETVKKDCQQCHASLIDAGKVSDFLSPYGHYNDIETVTSGDGYFNMEKDSFCAHLFYCEHCDYQEVAFISEVLP